MLTKGSIEYFSSEYISLLVHQVAERAHQLSLFARYSQHITSTQMKPTVTNTYSIQYTSTKFGHIADILEMHLFIVNLIFVYKQLTYAIEQ